MIPTVGDSQRYRVEVDPTNMNNPHSLALMLVGHDQRVLEVGCSTGHVTEHLVAAGNHVVGVDLDPDAIEFARPLLDAAFVLNLDDQRVSEHVTGPFDVIVLGDVLEHVREPAVVLADVTKLLAATGRFVISLPNVAHIDVRLMLLAGDWEYQHDGLLDATHLRWFTRASIRRLLDECGLVATRAHRVVVPPRGSNLPINQAVMTPAVMELLERDPDAESYQFVFEAQRKASGLTDALAADPVDFTPANGEAGTPADPLAPDHASPVEELPLHGTPDERTSAARTVAASARQRLQTARSRWMPRRTAR